VDDGVASLHGGGDGNRIGHVPQGHGGTHPVRVERRRDASRIPYQDPDVVAVAPERGHRMGPDEPGSPGYEHQHVPPPSGSPVMIAPFLPGVGPAWCEPYLRNRRIGAMMVVMSDKHLVRLEPRRARWMRDNRLAASIMLGIGLGLVWGITVGVGFAVVVGYGVIRTLEVFVPGGLLLGLVVGVAISRGRKPKAWSGSRIR
jgi:hypothetical protein